MPSRTRPRLLLGISENTLRFCNAGFENPPELLDLFRGSQADDLNVVGVLSYRSRLDGVRRGRRTRLRTRDERRIVMAQKVIEVVGTSKESFAKAAENAVAEAAKTVRGLKWARVAELEMELDGKKIAQYRATTKIYFDIEK